MHRLRCLFNATSDEHVLPDTHLLTHTHRKMHTHTWMHTHTHTHTCTHIHTHTHTHTDAHTHMHTHTHSRARSHTYECTHTRIHAYGCIHTRVLTHTHGHTHTSAYSCARVDKEGRSCSSMPEFSKHSILQRARQDQRALRNRRMGSSVGKSYHVWSMHTLATLIAPWNTGAAANDAMVGHVVGHVAATGTVIPSQVQCLQPSCWLKAIDTEGIVIDNATRAATNSTAVSHCARLRHPWLRLSPRQGLSGVRLRTHTPLSLEFLVGGLPLLQQHRELLGHLLLEIQHGVERVGAAGRQDYVSPRLPQHGHLSNGVCVYHHRRSGEGTGQSCSETHDVSRRA